MVHILVVDDNEQVRRMLGRMCEKHGYCATLAADAAEAKKCLDEQAFDLVLCDVEMPGESGVDLTRYIGSMYRDTAVIMVTGVDDPKVADSAIDAGTYGYIIKPFNPSELIINIRNALRRRDLEINNRHYRENLEQMVAARTGQWREALSGTIKAMSLAVEKRDPYTAGHQQRVADLAVAIADVVGLSAERREGVYLAGIVHDLGKISVPAEILSKPGRLCGLEFGLIKNHCEVGYDILKEVRFPWPIAQMVLQHHEKMDGSGYPRGLSGEDILPEARILCVADVVEAMASHRPYRPAMGIDAALEEISSNGNKLYDPDVVKACLGLFRKKGFTFDM